jgi:hypothetical protein
MYPIFISDYDVIVPPRHAGPQTTLDEATHSVCGGKISFRLVNVAERAVHCDRCGLRMTLPLYVDTFAALREIFCVRQEPVKSVPAPGTILRVLQTWHPRATAGSQLFVVKKPDAIVFYNEYYFCAQNEEEGVFLVLDATMLGYLVEVYVPTEGR